MFSGLASYMNNLVGGQSEQAKREAMLEALRVGSMEIAFELKDVNFDQIRRKRAFYKGVNIQLTEEMDKEVLLDFTNAPDVLPMKPKDKSLAEVDFDELMKKVEGGEEEKQEETPGANGNLFNYDTQSQDEKANLLERFALIRKRTIKMKREEAEGKVVGIIFNTYVASAGVREQIESTLYDHDIGFEFIDCTQNLDPYRLVFELEMDKYCALVAVGGDGTFNQMVNGMLARPDDKHVPVAIIPAGTSNDAARSLGVVNSEQDITQALKAITHCETITMDTVRVLLDHDSESSLPEGEERLQYCRHMLSNSQLCMPAKIASGANTWKGCCGGSSSFSMSTYLQAFSCGFVADSFSLTIDDVQFNDQGNLNTALMMINNGKYANGGAIMNPYAAVNDGLIDITWISDPSYFGTLGVTGILSDARGNGGIQAYKGHSQYVRGKKIRIDVPVADEVAPAELELNDNADADAEAEGSETPSTPEPAAIDKQVCIIDGEPLQYERSILWECFPGNIEILFSDSYFQQVQTFSRVLSGDVQRDRVISQVVDKIWGDFDKDNSGRLDKEETRGFLKSVLADLPPPNNYDESKFDVTFTAIDKNENGTIEKNEMAYFIKCLLHPTK